VLAWPGALPVVRSDQLVLVVAAHEGCGSSLGPRRPVIESADHQRAAMVGNVRYEPLSNEERMVADAVVLPRPGSPTAPVVVRTHGIVESQCTPRLSHFTYGEDP
jgi:hypothetical protein